MFREEAAPVKKRIGLFAAALTLLLALCSCTQMAADDLYQLPQLSEGYLQLQSAIDSVLAAGAEYASPAAGSNRQSIQREDIDGDGYREVLAFFNVPGSDRPLKIYIFRSQEGEYTQMALIEGEGSGFESVSYLDMDGDGVREIAVGWQISAGINTLAVYSLKGWQVNQIVNTNYSEFAVCSLDQDRGSEILVLRLSSSELTGEAEHYALTADGEIVTSTARISNGAEALLRVRSTGLTGGANAILVESAVGGSYVTDIFACRNGKLTNITLDETSGTSDTVRGYTVYCRDINSDGILDVPRPVALPATSESTTYYMIEWYSYSPYGGRRLVSTTYNNYADSWYLVLPREWIGQIAVRREEGVTGERMIVFSRVDEAGTILEDFLAVYTLTGENREERAAVNGRFVLLQEEETVFAAKLLVEPEGYALPLSQELLRDNFGFIYSEWITGET